MAFFNEISNENYDADAIFEAKDLSKEAQNMEREFQQALLKGADALDRAVVRYGLAAIRRAVSQKDLRMWSDYYLALETLGTVAKSSQAHALKVFTWVCGGRNESEEYVKENSFLISAKIKGVRVWGFKKDCGKALAAARKFVADYGHVLFNTPIKAPKKEVTPVEALADKALAFVKKYDARTKKTNEETAFAEKAREQLKAAGIDVDLFIKAARVLADAGLAFEEASK